MQLEGFYLSIRLYTLVVYHWWCLSVVQKTQLLELLEVTLERVSTISTE